LATRFRGTRSGPQPLAKLTRPKLYDAVPRPRLFALLDEAATRPIVWLSGAPGVGKTTLVASYLEARRLRHLWYHCDVGDVDSATFVHYLRLGVAPLAGNAATTLPALTSEPQHNLPRFVRSFFRDLFSALPHPCVVVFDNFHEPPTRTEERAALAQGLDEVPDGVTVVVISRSDPPAEFARLIASGRIARVDEAELRCTATEAQAILGAAHPLEREQLQRIHAQSDGWVAALVLLREHISRRGSTQDELLDRSKDAIFHYFAGEILAGSRPENQRTLMLTAVPPSITASEAVELSGNEEAPRLLEYLYQHHLFTDRRRGEQLTYHYHALFREFLLEELDKTVSRAERRTLGARAANLLSARGQQGEALALFRDAGDWESMRSVIHAHASEWVRQGRAQAVSDWIEALPKDLRERDPWLEYWFGRAWIFVQPDRGRAAVERAYEAFHAAGDLRGLALALSAIVNSYYYEWANFSPLDRWLPAFNRLLGDEAAKDLDRESELRARAALLVLLLLRRPNDAGLEPCARRLDEVLDGESDLNVRVEAASTLFNYINWNTDGAAAIGLMARIEPIIAKPEVSPLMQVTWRTHVSFWHYMNGRYAEATAVMTEARAIAQRYGLETYLFDIDHAEATALINKGEHAAASVRLDELERRLSPTRRMQWPFYHHLRSVLEQRLGHARASLQHAERAVELARELDIPSLQLPHFLARLAQARAALGEREAAMSAVDEAIALAAPNERGAFERRRELLQIEADLEAGDIERVCAGLGCVLADHRSRGDFVFMRSRPDLAARLANVALGHGIETEFVRSLIKRDALVAPTDAGAAWPFRLRIRVLGGFELSRDGQPVRFTGKLQERPLELLKLVVAHGGRDVEADYAMGALWPDSDGAAAKRTFDSALFRLRKLLEVDDAIELTAGKLSLARSLVWTDVSRFEAALDNARSDREDGMQTASPAVAARRLLDAYPGPLLGSEETSWIAQPRDALRGRFIRALTGLAERLEREGDWATAIDVYRRGLEADNLAESFYRGLMRSLAATGDRAEALNAFRRCRELLSIVLGIKPSPETDRLYRDIAGAG
jgi:ATP/maltotriose-dependent transcriptional regulator MalT/DNA-binding SARP family transcriptional activator